MYNKNHLIITMRIKNNVSGQSDVDSLVFAFVGEV